MDRGTGTDLGLGGKVAKLGKRVVLHDPLLVMMKRERGKNDRCVVVSGRVEYRGVVKRMDFYKIHIHEQFLGDESMIVLMDGSHDNLPELKPIKKFRELLVRILTKFIEKETWLDELTVRGVRKFLKRMVEYSEWEVLRDKVERALRNLDMGIPKDQKMLRKVMEAMNIGFPCDADLLLVKENPSHDGLGN